MLGLWFEIHNAVGQYEAFPLRGWLIVPIRRGSTSKRGVSQLEDGWMEDVEWEYHTFSFSSYEVENKRDTVEIWDLVSRLAWVGNSLQFLWGDLVLFSYLCYSLMLDVGGGGECGFGQSQRIQARLMALPRIFRATNRYSNRVGCFIWWYEQPLRFLLSGRTDRLIDGWRGWIADGGEERRNRRRAC